MTLGPLSAKSISRLLNKNIKIVLNRSIAIAIAALLIWSLSHQLQGQLKGNSWQSILHIPRPIYLMLAILLLPVNIAVETRKWQLLASSAQKISYWKALKSVLGGITFSIITPNRIGEYPGRLVFLNLKSTPRLLAVSILGAVSQFLTVLLYGFAGMCFYLLANPMSWGWAALVIDAVLVLLVWLFYWRFEQWAPKIEGIKWLRKFGRFGHLLRRFSKREQRMVLLFALGRFAIFTSQYYLVLSAVGVHLPFLNGFFLCALFFWVIAVVPSVFLMELGIRGYVSTYLFLPYAESGLLIIAATLGIWLLNLFLPAFIGGLLLLRMRWLK